MAFEELFLALSSGDIDVSTTITTATMERDVFYNGNGYTFSDPYFYSGTTFGGIPEFVDCVDQGDTFSADCQDVIICVTFVSSHREVIEEKLPTANLFELETGTEMYGAFSSGDCNVIAESLFVDMEQRTRNANYTGDFKVSEKGSWNSEPLAMTTRQSDPVWAELCNWILRSLITAEYLNITAATADSFPETSVSEIDNEFFIRAIKAVGNYGEMLARKFSNQTFRQGFNSVNRGSQVGRLYSFPLGDTRNGEDVAFAVPNGTLEQLQTRGYLRCGVFGDSPGFAMFNNNSGPWEGLDIDFCTALSAGVFAKIIRVTVEDFSETNEALAALANGSIDVLAGGSPVLNVNLSFSDPYFFDAEGTRRTLVTRHSDPQWTDFVRWVVQAPLYAEAMEITRNSPGNMPIISGFGPDYKLMFRTVISVAGNYVEMYNRSLGSIFPERGQNSLSSGSVSMHVAYEF